jgi:hypothetical protein
MKTTKTATRLYPLVAVLTLLALPGSAAEQAGKSPPAAVSPAPAQTDAVPEKIQFGPVIEVVLGSDLGGKDYLLDLDKGRVLTPAQEMTPNRLWNSGRGLTFQSSARAWVAYLYRLGVEIVNEDHLKGLACYNTAMDPVEGSQWNSLSAIECARAAERLWRAPRPMNRSTISFESWAKLPHTFIFCTRGGCRGMLQITEIQRDPKRVKIRYKLVRESGR